MAERHSWQRREMRKGVGAGRVFPIAQTVKNLPAMQENLGSIPGSGRSPGEGSGIPHQYFCLGNPMDREAWWATVHGVTKGQT